MLPDATLPVPASLMALLASFALAPTDTMREPLFDFEDIRA
jgi:hypothetical protein